jgi:catechol 2,3-dioxygenase-like lactoylglutathione lyase family enzyme
MISHLKFVGIPTKNQDAALAFWTEKMGFKVATDQPFDDQQRWIELKIPGAETRVVLFLPEGHENRVGGFFSGSFACDNVEQTYEILKARGVEFVSPPQVQPWGKFCLFKDSEGNQFVLGTA